MNDGSPRARPATAAALTLGLGLVVAACGGGTSGKADIGGSLSGLASGTSLTLQNNGSDTLALSANGSFRFGQSVAGGGAYAVRVLTQPAGQACTVASGSGSVNSSGDSINTVNVTCVSITSVGGTVAGLLAGTSVTLSNGTVLLPIAINGSFAFPGLLSAGQTYTVTVATQPVGLNCSVLNGSGTVVAGTTVTIMVTCS